MKYFLQKRQGLVFIFLLILGASFWAQGDKDSISESKDSFVITSDSSWCYTDTECTFTLIVPEISPNQVNIGNPLLPEGAEFLASYKDLWVEGANSGTSIRLLFTFSRSGSIEIPPLDIMVDGNLYKVPFAPVEVLQNPRSLKPQVILSFQDEQGQNLSLQEDGNLVISLGKQVLVTVSVQYGVALTGFQWNLVPNAIFQQVANFQGTFNQEEVELSHQLQPVAQFNLIPLETGSLSLPPMELEVQGYDQKIHRLFTSNVSIVSSLSTDKVPSSSGQTETTFQAQQALASAFTALPEENQNKVVNISFKDAQKLAYLRWQEQKTFPWNEIFQKRVELEKKLGLEPSEREKSWPLSLFFLGLGFIMIVITVFSIVKRGFFLSVILGFFGIIALVWGITYTGPLLKPAGILASQTLSKIPELDATNLFPMTPYSRLEIKKEVLGWYYVSVGGLEGWAPVEQVVLITESLVPIDSL